MTARAGAGALVQRDARPSAADLARAEELYDNGRTLFAEGSYDAAATAFEQAHALSGNLDMLYNAALAYDRAGRFEEAIGALDRYRALAPASERARLDERKKSLQLRLDKQREAAAAAADDPEPVVPEPAATTDTPPPEPQPRTRRVRGRTWALLGASAVGLAVGTGLGATALARSRDARGRCTGTDGDLLCADAVADEARSARPLAIGADVMFAVGAAAGVAFIALLVVDLRRAKVEPAASAQVRLRPHGGGLALDF